jgi:DNA-directed RNA polymerase subunit M/transcription elongation factor TFIIS
MYYIRISENEDNKLEFYCRHCGNIDNTQEERICIINSHNSSDEQTYNYTINEFTKNDPTLPRIYNIQCPNSECKSNQGTKKPAEIIYMRYDDNNLKYAYICVDCDRAWKTDG